MVAPRLQRSGNALGRTLRRGLPTTYLDIEPSP